MGIIQLARNSIMMTPRLDFLAIRDFLKTLLRYRTSKVFSSLHWEGIFTQILNHTSRKNKGTSKYDPKNVKNVIKVKFSFLGLFRLRLNNQ